jgi:nucleoside-diphosphate-sugar epimerase
MRMFHKLYGLPIAIVRPYMTYGPRQRARKLVPSLALALLRGVAPTVTQPDRQVDWIYIDDVVEGILAAGSAEGVEGKTFDLGSGELFPIRAVAELLENLIGGPAAVSFSSGAASVGEHGRRADVAPAAEHLAWRATTSLRSGLEQTVAWYRSRMNDYAAAQ